MRTMKFLAIVAGITSLAGVIALMLAAGAGSALFAKFVIAVAALGFVGLVLSYLMQLAQEALAIRNEESYWH